MKGMLILPILIAAASSASAQFYSKKYAGRQTITCFAGGAMIVQEEGAADVAIRTTGVQSTVSFTGSNGRRKIDFGIGGISCLIEDLGRESVPVVGRIERQRKAEEAADEAWRKAMTRPCLPGQICSNAPIPPRPKPP